MCLRSLGSSGFLQQIQFCPNTEPQKALEVSNISRTDVSTISSRDPSQSNVLLMFTFMSEGFYPERLDCVWEHINVNSIPCFYVNSHLTKPSFWGERRLQVQRRAKVSVPGRQKQKKFDFWISWSLASASARQKASTGTLGSLITSRCNSLQLRSGLSSHLMYKQECDDWGSDWLWILMKANVGMFTGQNSF